MGITAVLETEDRRSLSSVEDPENVLHQALPPAGNLNYQHLSVIDWYGKTTFNYLQAPRLLAEWQALGSFDDDAEGRRVVEAIEHLINRLASERGLYLTFYGD